MDRTDWHRDVGALQGAIGGKWFGRTGTGMCVHCKVQ